MGANNYLKQEETSLKTLYYNSDQADNNSNCSDSSEHIYENPYRDIVQSRPLPAIPLEKSHDKNADSFSDLDMEKSLQSFSSSSKLSVQNTNGLHHAHHPNCCTGLRKCVSLLNIQQFYPTCCSNLFDDFSTINSSVSSYSNYVSLTKKQIKNTDGSKSIPQRTDSINEESNFRSTNEDVYTLIPDETFYTSSNGPMSIQRYQGVSTINNEIYCVGPAVRNSTNQFKLEFEYML